MGGCVTHPGVSIGISGRGPRRGAGVGGLESASPSNAPKNSHLKDATEKKWKMLRMDQKYIADCFEGFLVVGLQQVQPETGPD